MSHTCTPYSDAHITPQKYPGRASSVVCVCVCVRLYMYVYACVCVQHLGQGRHHCHTLLCSAPAGFREHTGRFPRFRRTFRAELPGRSWLTTHTISCSHSVCVYCKIFDTHTTHLCAHTHNRSRAHTFSLKLAPSHIHAHALLYTHAHTYKRAHTQ